MSYGIESGNVLLSSNLFFGKLYVKDQNEDIEVYETLALIDERKMAKGILINNETYPIEGLADEEHFESLCSFEELLASRHLNCFVKSIYTTLELEAAIAAYNRTFEMSAEELLGITKVSKVAADWWTDYILNPKEEKYDNSIGAIMANAIATTVKEYSSVPTEEQIGIFNSVLQNQIRMDLLAYGCCVIGDNYNFSRKLDVASRTAEINSSFPWNTTMTVYSDEVVLKNSEGEKVLYNLENPYQKIKIDSI